MAPRIFDPKDNEIMVAGKFKGFNGQEGFGFIAPDDDNNVVFVHISSVERAGQRSAENLRVG